MSHSESTPPSEEGEEEVEATGKLQQELEPLRYTFEQQGWWGLAPEVKLGMLRTLCHDLLDLPLLR